MIKNKRKTNQCFSFGPVTYDDISKKANNLDTAKKKFTLIEKKVVSGVGQKEIVSEKVISEDQAVADVFNRFLIM